MKFLFLNKNFYEYDEKIKNQLKRFGHEVKDYCITPELTAAEKCLKRLGRTDSIHKRIAEYQNNILQEIEREDIDVVFVLAGQGLMAETVEALRKRYPQAVFCWYIWDNISNLQIYSVLNQYFDLIISFDKIEACEKGLAHIPLFYVHNGPSEIRKYDISMIGQDRDYRRRIILDLINRDIFKNYFFYLKTGRFSKIKSMLTGKMTEYRFLHNRALPYTETERIMRESNIVLDIPAPNQTGLTMRTIESLGSHTKLITTNHRIKEYDFYNPENVLVIDPDNIVIPDKFINNRYVELEENIVKNYCIESWISHLLEHINHVRNKEH